MDAFTAVDLLEVPAGPMTTWMLVITTTSLGLRGLGEATVPSRSDALAGHLVRSFDRHVRGRPVEEAADVISALRHEPASGQLARAAAISSLEQAICDASARSRRTSTSDLLGPPLRDTVPVYANINRGIVDRTAAGFAAAAQAAAAAGFTAVKCAPFDGVAGSADRADRQHLAAGLERLHAVRAALPAGVDLFVDCHGRLNRRQAVEVAAALAALGVTWFEEPLATHPTMGAVQAERDTPGRGGTTSGVRSRGSTVEDRRYVADCAHEMGLSIAGGEFLFGLPEFVAALAEGTVDIIMPDVKYCGGVTTAFTVSQLCADNGTRFAPHNPSGPVGLAATLQVCRSGPSLEILELQVGAAEEQARRTSVTPSLEVRDGCISVPAGPGHGVDLCEESLAGMGARPVVRYP